MATDSDEYAYPHWWSLALIVPAACVLVAAIAVPLGRRAARLTVTEALRYE